MVDYIVYVDKNDEEHKKHLVLSNMQDRKMKYATINMDSLLSDFVKLGESSIEAIIVTDLDKMGDILKDAITPLIKKLSTKKEIYIFVDNEEYTNKKSKLLRIDNE